MSLSILANCIRTQGLRRLAGAHLHIMALAEVDKMKLLALGAIAVVSFTSLLGQEPKQEIRTDLTCVENMAIPLPDGRNRYVGTARVLISIGSDGAQVNVVVHTGSSKYGEFEAWLWASLQDSKFSTKCAGQTIEVNFIYELRGAATREPQSRIRMKNPNTFEVISNSLPAQA